MKCWWLTHLLSRKNSIRSLSTSHQKCTPNVIVEKLEEGVTTIGINRPEKRNCFNPATIGAAAMEQPAIMGVFCRRSGVPLIDGGPVRLPQLIGLSRAMDLILTGRPVSAKEAYEMGLANRICAHGASLSHAVQLAGSLAKFPQGCMNVDRTSALNAVYDSKSFEEAIKFELEKGLSVIREESSKGAKSFVDGVGRLGSFENLKSKP